MPESWDECTLKMVMETQKIQELSPNAPIIAVISGYVGIPYNVLVKSKATEVQELLEGLTFIYDDYVPVPVNSFTYNGEKYECDDDILNIRFDQWVSLETVLHNYKDNPIEGLPKMIASLFMKPQENIDDFDLNERAQLFHGLPFTVARDLEGFFLHSRLALEETTQLYSIIKEQERLVPIQLKEVLSILSKRKEQSTTSWRTKRVIGIYQKYLKSLQKGWEKSYSSLHTDA